MAKDPAVLFYTSDFLSGTFTMDYEQKGKYITLLCIQHQKGFLTEKDLKQILTDTDIELFNKFELLEDGYYYNNKMKECAEKRRKFSESRSNNRKGKSKKKSDDLDMNNISSSYNKHMNNISKSYLKDMENENENEDLNEDLNVNVNESVNVNEHGVHLHTQITNTNIANKIVNNLLQYDNTKLHKEALEDLHDIGGINKLAEILEWDDSVLNNHIRAINQSIQIHNNK
jgi:hypothetical protein